MAKHGTDPVPSPGIRQLRHVVRTRPVCNVICRSTAATLRLQWCPQVRKDRSVLSLSVLRSPYWSSKGIPAVSGFILDWTDCALKMDTTTGKTSDGKLEYSDGEVSDQQQPAMMEASSRIDAKKTLRQMDYRVVPIVTVLYLLSFLDRGCVKLRISQLVSKGKALTQKAVTLAMRKCRAWKRIWSSRATGTTSVSRSTRRNIHGDSTNRSPAYTVFFFPYALLELPANLLLKKLSPSIWLPSIMVAWGLVTTLTGIVQGYNGLIACRVMLGVAEAGQYPGCAYYLTTWYAPADLGLRQGLFFSAAALAGSFSGLLAYALAQMDGVGGLAGWR